MDVEIFALCDAATDYAGKLNLLGTFDSVHGREFPLVFPHCAVALRLRFERIEEGTHRVRMNFVDEDGRAVIPTLDNTVTVRLPPDEPSICTNMVLNIQGMKFEKPGRYAIDLAIDGRHERSLPITVREAPQMPARPE